MNKKDKSLHAVNHAITFPKDVDNFIEYHSKKNDYSRSFTVSNIIRNSKEFKQYLKEMS